MSYGLYVGKNLTKEGIAYLAGYGDEPSSHWLEIVPRRRHGANARVTVGVTSAALMPGRLIDIPEAAQTARHIRVSYSSYRGLPAPLTNGGLNEHGVAVRDVWSPSRDELRAMTPKDQTGPNYSDLARIVMERARTAREGVEIIGRLIADYGYSTYGGNSHMIADPNEAWVVIEFAGGQRLWAAERLGPDCIRVSRPGYIGKIPIKPKSEDRFLHAPHLVDFAVSQGWHTGASGDAFDVNAVYGDDRFRWDGVRWIEEQMAQRAARPGGITLEDIMWAMRTERLTGDTAGYGQVVPLTTPEYAELRMLWHAHIGAIAAPFVPVFMAADAVPEEFRQHRYLTSGESARFIDRRIAHERREALSVVPQGIESTTSAAAVFRRLLYLVLEHENEFLPELTAIWVAVEARLIELASRMQGTGKLLLRAGESQLACEILSYFTATELNNALMLASTLAAGFEARTRAVHGIRTSSEPRSHDQVW